MPTPGSKAYHERQARLEKKGKLKPADTEAAEGSDDESVQNLQKQRQQPTGKSRAKKGKK
jgi:YidC/Oxa1 family membrane protein insertase